MADNRRVKLTKKMIKDAYLELLEQYPSEKISVTDICKAADVNRSTFYMYYDDIVSLRQKIENEVLEQLPGASEAADPLASQHQLLDTLERFFNYIRENQRLFRILLLQSDSKSFNNLLIDTVLKKFHANEAAKNPTLRRYGYVYAVNGVIGMLSTWLEEDFPISSRQFAEIAYNMSVLSTHIDEIDMNTR
ncbi:MAG: TetR/AcrR family transcriptional regulator [Eubacteriaceae bacterium]|jgi:AcrR family transcriptional regulator|nr:TetR/AcrR family transcriptional regulator [Eubacteriaceae bacterium]